MKNAQEGEKDISMRNKKTIWTIWIRRIVFLIISVILIAFAFTLSNHYYKDRSYSGDRITGTFIMTVSGKEYNPVEKMLYFHDKDTQRLSTSGSSFSIKGGEYGPYEIIFLLDNKELYKLTGDIQFDLYTKNPQLTFRYFNSNWWRITRMELSAEIFLVEK
jgi:hypothetical protein